MKKIFITMVAALAASIFFASCASIPEPSEKNTVLVYGTAEYLGMYQNDVTKRKTGIKLVLKNLDNNRSYTVESNSKGEFTKFNIPTGYYSIKEISSDFIYDDRNFTTKCEPKKTDAAARFAVKTGVTNIGHVKINVNFSDGVGYTSWGGDFNDVKNFFYSNYPESEWNFQEWRTMNGEDQEY